jgi:hypothetical protein
MIMKCAKCGKIRVHLAVICPSLVPRLVGSAMKHTPLLALLTSEFKENGRMLYILMQLLSPSMIQQYMSMDLKSFIVLILTQAKVIARIWGLKGH